MRTLVIAGEYPWPEDRGPRLRLAMVLRALRGCGPVDLFSAVSKFRTDLDPPDSSLGLDRVSWVGFDNRPPTGAHLGPSLVRPHLPLGLPWQDGPTVRRALARFASGHYDLVWCFGARPWVLTGAPLLAPTVLDLDDLEDQKILGRLAVPRPSSASWSERGRRMGSALMAREEIRRWQRLHRRAGREASAVVVCSDLDAERARASGVVRVAVVPNGYRSVDHPLGRLPVGAPPTVLFQGLLRYPPNIEAARWLAHDVAPRLRTTVPDLAVRLVGEHGPELMDLDDRPRVSVVGRVPEMTTELARADVVVVPVRFGSGTRVKILEAFAHRIPVVSTTVGAEGIGAVDGVHLLVGDDAPALADACARLLTDPDLRRTVTDGAHRLFEERFRSEVVEEAVARLAFDVAGRAERPAHPGSSSSSR
jgi:glycosyltransferase involved in cell wall biosynthesis